MEFSTQKKSLVGVSPDREAHILHRLEHHREELGAKKHIPETAIAPLLEKGKQLLSENPETFEAVAKQILKVASNMTAADARDFLRKQVTSETFDFQRCYKELRAESDQSLAGLCGLHINSAHSLSLLKDSTMAPVSKRNLTQWDRSESDNYRVCFASGNIDSLSRFLVGHALLRHPIEGNKGQPQELTQNMWRMSLAQYWAQEPTMQRFADTFALAVVSGQQLPAPDGYHDIESPVRSTFGIVDFIEATKPSRVNVLTLPATVLLPRQIKELREESEGHLLGALYENNRLDVASHPDQYVLTVHAELLVKYRLKQQYDVLSAQGDSTRNKAGYGYAA